MPIGSFNRLLCAALLVLLVSAGLSATETAAAEKGESARFSLHFRSGEHVAANDLEAWPITGSSTNSKLGRRDLFAKDNPVRLIRDHEAKIELRVPLVIMANGDVITGLPRQLVATDGRQGQLQQVRLQLDSPLMPVDGTGVSVRTDRVQRIIGQESRQRRPAPEPGTVVLLDGRELKGSSIRWQEYGLSILTDDGIVQAEFTDLADVVFPQVDQLAAVVEDSLGAGSMTGPAIMRLAINSGAVLTGARVSREVERIRSRKGSTVEVMYYVQPAWSSHPIAIPESEIAWIGYRQSSEIPLSLLPAETHVNQRLIGKPQTWLRNRSHTGPMAASGRLESDLGLATHSISQIVFKLPAGAASLSTTVGLDRSAGNGGCVRCRIAEWDASARQPGTTLWDSGILQGSDGPKSTGAVNVQSLANIVLITDDAHDERPAGADPLDIRDAVCWLAPLVEIDPQYLRRPEAVAQSLPGLNVWQQQSEDWSRVSVGERWSEAADRWEAVLSIPANTKLQLRRTAKITSLGDVLEMVTAVSRNPTEQQLELRVNDQVVEWLTSEDREAMATRHEKYVQPWIRRNNRFSDMREELMSDTLAYWWDLQEFRGREVTLDLTLSAGSREVKLVWQDCSLRSAIGNLPASGELPKVDVKLTEATLAHSSLPHNRYAFRDLMPYRGKDAQPIRFLGQVRTGGYGMVRNSQLTFELKPEYRKFVAVVGSCYHTSGALRVMVDGKVLWERPKMNSLRPAELIELPLPADAKQLTLINGVDGIYESAAAWTDAGFIVAK
ncbi:NPCBM/NEW2 domain protein [Anatilimnocola aggregata]|uniref:NPCBM/NEW2 domain protein n=1 Tax=Anatilimnocola aggregata TaxID=2528021 RepID=A0A517YBQ8_9BACT|nr:NPCBM/NEW2 domain-containing protein [Anatilimnocola aggregata]QDU27654.1 NPCBM/NEW2 domain protein [Anatilimnocola aggregata]